MTYFNVSQVTELPVEQLLEANRSHLGLHLPSTLLDKGTPLWTDGGQGLQPEDAIVISALIQVYTAHHSNTKCSHLLFAIQDNGALAKFTFSGDHDDSKPVTVEVCMTEADFSGAKLGTSGAIILAAWLQHKVESHN